MLSEDERLDIVCEISGDYDRGLFEAIELVITARTQAAVREALEQVAAEIEAVPSVEWALAGRGAGLDAAHIVRAAANGSAS